MVRQTPVAILIMLCGFVLVRQSASQRGQWKNCANMSWYLSSKVSTWQEAKRTCVGIEARLAFVPNEQANDCVKDIMRRSRITQLWIGLNDLAQEHVYKWSHDDSLVRYTNWDIGEPNRYYPGEDCVLFAKYRQRTIPAWHDYLCTHRSNFLCQRELTINECGKFDYTFIPRVMTFDRANLTCARQGDQWTMAMPRTEQENTCVYQTKNKYARTPGVSVWLGFFRYNVQPYQAVDERPLGQTFWDPPHPKRNWHKTGPIMWSGARRPWLWGDAYHYEATQFYAVCQKAMPRSYWSPWQPWSSCSASCGRASQESKRTCNTVRGALCEGSDRKFRNCQLPDCPREGGWSVWKAMSPCSVTCGEGVQYFERKCNNPKPSSENVYCEGKSEEKRRCEATSNCPLPINGVYVRDWAKKAISTLGISTQHCPTECNDGQYFEVQERACTKPHHGGQACSGSSMRLIPCPPVNRQCQGNFTSWIEVQVGNQQPTCGQAYKILQRNCNNRNPGDGAQSCIGPTVKILPVELDECSPKNQTWSAWRTQNGCPATCGKSYQLEVRDCQGHAEYGGFSCHGLSRQLVPCQGTSPCNGFNVCPPIPIVGNGFYQDLGSIGVMRYSCKEGYELKGSGFVRCKWVSGKFTWPQAQPRCELTYCPKIYAPRDGRIHLADVPAEKQFAHPNVVRFSCSVGFELTNSAARQRQCLKNGSWSGVAPSCQPVKCNSLTAPRNGWMSPPAQQGSFHFPQQRVFGCNHGYYVASGSRLRQCGSDRQWTGHEAECRIVDCGKPPVGARLQVNFQKTTFRETVNYRCEKGYQNQGDEVSHCEAHCEKDGNGRQNCSSTSGKWSKKPVCGSSVETCRPVGMKHVYFPEPVTFSSAESMCEEYGSGWSMVLPRGIEENQCVYDKKSKHELSGNGSNQALWLGFTAKPPRHLYIGVDGKPLGIPMWVTGNPAPTNFESCTLMDGKGQFEGQWRNVLCTMKHPFMCQKLVTCSGSIEVEKGVVSGNDNDFHTKRNFQCNVGYKIKGPSFSQCLWNGTWSVKRGLCVIVTCDAAIEVTNGQASGGARTFQSKQKIFCKRGFKLDGPKETECQANGQWSIPSFNCSPVDCGAPLVRDYSRVTSPKTTFLSKAEYTCDRSYNLRGPKSVTCNARCHPVKPFGAACPEWRGEWSHLPPTCTAVPCGALQTPSNGWMDPPDDQGTFAFPEKRIFGCNRGFFLANSFAGISTRRCRDNGQWSGQKAECKQVDCGQPRVGEHLQVIAQRTTVGSRAEYRCERGYTLEGELSTQCLANCRRLEQRFLCSQSSGVWSGTVPKCNPVPCRQLSAPVSGFIRSISVSGQTIQHNGSTINGHFPMSVMFGCIRSHKFVDKAFETRNCTAAGQWTGSKPQCFPVCYDITCPSAVERCVESETPNEGKCVCWDDRDCPSQYKPACGSDGRTYNHPCLVHVAGCKANKMLNVVGNGFCKQAGNCHFPKPYQVGSCRATSRLYFYNYTAQECQPFNWGRCFRGSNRFISLSDCQETCEVDVCKLPKNEGPCVESVREPRYYYNQISRVCEPFNYTTCFGNENNFPTERICRDVCQAPQCPEVPAITNGKQTGRSRRVGSVLTFSCNRDYQLIGAAERRCLRSQQWTGQSASCRLMCPPPRCAQGEGDSICGIEENRPFDACRDEAKAKTSVVAVLKIKDEAASCSSDDHHYILAVRVKKMIHRAGNCATIDKKQNWQLKISFQGGCPCPYPVKGQSYLVTGDCMRGKKVLTLHRHSLFRPHSTRVENNLSKRCVW